MLRSSKFSFLVILSLGPPPLGTSHRSLSSSPLSMLRWRLLLGGMKRSPANPVCNNKLWALGHSGQCASAPCLAHQALDANLVKVLLSLPDFTSTWPRFHQRERGGRGLSRRH